MKTLPYLIFPLSTCSCAGRADRGATSGRSALRRWCAGSRQPRRQRRVWKCADGRCTGPAETRRIALQKACKTLARKIGAVTSISAGGAALASEDLDTCNGTVRVDVAERERAAVATQP